MWIGTKRIFNHKYSTWLHEKEKYICPVCKVILKYNRIYVLWLSKLVGQVTVRIIDKLIPNNIKDHQKIDTVRI